MQPDDEFTPDSTDDGASLTQLAQWAAEHEAASAERFAQLHAELQLLREQLAQVDAAPIADAPPPRPVQEPTMSAAPPAVPGSSAPATPASPAASLPMFVGNPTSAAPAASVEPEPFPGAVDRRDEPTGMAFANRSFAAAARPAPGDWDEVLLGRDLSYDPALASDREELLDDLQTQTPGAMALVGAVLEFRAAEGDRVPPLLKEVGEAFYQWRPYGASAGGHDPFRDTLIAWLEQRCDAAGAGNRIELVRVGDRYDSMRHNARTRGVEVTDVHGWVVLRDNGKVYTKANVSVR